MWILDKLEELKYSNVNAVIHRENSLTFSELYEYSESIASYIVDNFEADKRPILIYGNKDINIIPCMVACLKAGRAYIPVDISTPKERVLQIVNDSNCEAIFNISDIDLCVEISCIDKEKLQTLKHYKGSSITKKIWVDKDDDCYIIFTSGSTGRPKGVPITRKNLESMASWISESLNMKDDGQYVLDEAPYSFDLSVLSLYTYLPMGKTLYSVDKKMLQSMKELFSYLEKSDLGVWISTPSFADLCCYDESFSDKLLPKLKKFIFIGEILPKNLAKKLYERFDDVNVINGYGPTEATVLISECLITEEMINSDGSLPVGNHMPNSTIKIVNDKNEEVKDGEVGELVIIGDSVSNGYFNNPSENEKVFFKDKSGTSGYYTGDLMYKHGDMLYYVARKNFQVKLNGFRIELEDIQSNINKLDYISNNIVLPIYIDEKVSSLVCFAKLSYDMEISNIKLGLKVKSDLKDILPSYMIPKKIYALKEFPLNNNGKIDRKKLMEGIK